MAQNHIAELEKRLWSVADELRANSDLKSSEYSTPVLGLIFLKYADYRFAKQEKIIKNKSTGRRRVSKTDYQADGVMYLPDEARFSHWINYSEMPAGLTKKRINC
jgi:type I restriction enzyme M protein